MRWFKPNLRNSLHAIFSAGLSQPPDDDPDTVITIEHIRDCMLALVPEDGGERAAVVRRRIRYADSVEALWFMRGELMGVLARLRGEAAALQTISSVSEMFDDLLPEGLRSRPSPLGRG